MTTSAHPRIAAKHPALQSDEVPMKATLANGQEITVLHQDGRDLYRAPGLPANFSGVANSAMPECLYFSAALPGGRTLSLFVNTETGLVCGDVVARDGNSGIEFLRMKAPVIVKSPRLTTAQRTEMEEVA